MKSFLARLGSFWRPHPGQREFLAASATTKVLACGRRWGKTDAAAVSLAREIAEGPSSRQLILAPTLDQAKLLFERVLDFLRLLLGFEDSKPPWREIRRPFPLLQFGSHRLSARSGHIGRMLRGNEATHIVVDEAAFVPEELITEVAAPMLATSNGSMTLL